MSTIPIENSAGAAFDNIVGLSHWRCCKFVDGSDSFRQFFVILPHYEELAKTVAVHYRFTAEPCGLSGQDFDKSLVCKNQLRYCQRTCQIRVSGGLRNIWRDHHAFHVSVL